MPIKQVEDLVEAASRGYSVICNACDCEDIRAPLEFVRKYSPLMGKYVLTIGHEGERTPLAIFDPDGVLYAPGWIANGLPSELHLFYRDITIIEKGGYWINQMSKVIIQKEWNRRRTHES